MGMTSNTSAPRLTLLNFVPLLGGVFVVSDENTAAIKAAREHAHALQTDGYSTAPGSSSAKARKFLQDKGIESVRLSGKLASISYDQSKVPSTGNVIEKALVMIADKDASGNDERFLMSLDMKNLATQKLIRKLENVEPGTDLSVVNLFATYDKNEDKGSPHYGCSFPDYSAEVKDADGNEIKGNPQHSDAIKAATDAVRSNMAAANITDKAVVGAAVSNVRADYHVKLTQEIQKKFESSHVEEAAHVATGVPAEDDASGEDYTFGNS